MLHSCRLVEWPSCHVVQGMGYDLKFRTNQLEHSFGCPFQIGHHANADKVRFAFPLGASG